MRKRIKVYSFERDERVVSLSEERPKVEEARKKELTFKFEFDKKQSNFQLAPLSEEQIANKIKKVK